MNITVSIAINMKHQINCLLLLHKQIDIEKLFSFYVYMLDSASIPYVEDTLANVDICCNYAGYQILCLSGSSHICLQAEAIVKFQLYFTTRLFFPYTSIIRSVTCRRGLMQKRFNVSAMYTDLKYRSPPTLPNKNPKL